MSKEAVAILRYYESVARGKISEAHRYLWSVPAEEAKEAVVALKTSSEGFYRTNGRHPSRFSIDDAGAVILQA